MDKLAQCLRVAAQSFFLYTSTVTAVLPHVIVTVTDKVTYTAYDTEL